MPERDLAAILGLTHPLSAVTHALGAVVVLLALPGLLARARAGDPRRVPWVGAYGGCLAGMFSASALYHGLPRAHALCATFWHLDHAAIWLVLATTFTALRVCAAEGHTRAPSIRLVWVVGVTGATLELSVLERLPDWVSPTLYIGMGWLGLPTLLAVARRHGWREGEPLLIGGLFGTLGGLMDALSAPNPWPGFVEAHELLHLCTLAAATPFLRAIWRHAPLPAPPEAPDAADEVEVEVPA